jgi:hypothetical protein
MPSNNYIYKMSNAGGMSTITRYTDMLAGNAAFVEPGDYESIATVTVGAGGTSSVTFSSIPSTYQHLQMRGIFRPIGASWIIANFNGDNAGNYSMHDLRGNGSSASGGVAIEPYVYFILGGTTASNTFAAGVIDILDYANTNKFKTLRSLSGIDTNGGGNIDLTSGSWRNTAAISSIVLTLNSGTNIPEYSQFALYGIKG